jgi:hypothetical protein
VGGKDGDGLAGLDEERIFRAKPFEFINDGVEAFPVSRGAADATIDDKVLRALGYFGIEVVHETAESGFLLPSFAAEGVAARGADDGGYAGDSHEDSCEMA